jgi:O-antigen/teichoic acid export membrane protein
VWLADIRNLLFDHRMRYVVANILITCLTFSRNLVFMRRLGLEDLGQVALAQTLVMLVSFLQFGLINGGYRIYASRNRQENEKVNNIIFTYIMAIALLMILVIMAGGHASVRIGVRSETLYFGFATGLATLASTWLNNCLIADGELGLSNRINIAAAGLSLGLVILPGTAKIDFALWSLFLQPFSMVSMTLVAHKLARPTGVRFSTQTLKQILSLGVIPFIAGIMALLNFQVERWSITSVMGPEYLGRFYLVIIYHTVFTMVPASLLNIYYPNAIREYEEKHYSGFRTILKKHSISLLQYIVLAIVCTGLLMKVTIAAILPKFAGATHLVYLALPGLIVLTLSDVIALYYNSIKKLSPLLYYGFSGLVLYIVFLGMLRAMNAFSLESVVIARSIAAIISGSILFLLYYNDGSLQLEQE